MTSTHWRSRFVLVVSLILFVSGLVPARERNSVQQSKDSIQEQDPLSRPTVKDRAKQERASKRYRDWVQDVSVIITDEELGAFRKLGTDAERDQFIYQFWLNRDPTPDTQENEYKDEFYRRKAYANEHFSAGIAGERTDRGRIYILHGKPDSIESHPMGGPYLRPAEEGGGTEITFPFEIWRYRHLDGISDDVTIEFVDACGCGEYRRTINRSDKDAGKNIPNSGMTDAEALNMASKRDRLIDPLGIGKTLFGQNNGAKIFDAIAQDAALERPPALRAVNTGISHIIRYKLMHFDVRVDFVKAALNTVLMPITVQVPNRELTFVNKDGVQRGVLNISGQMTTITGRIVQTFEDTVRLDVPPELLEKVVNNVALYWKALPMRPGRYRLDVVLKDVNGDKLGTFSKSVLVPEYGQEKLASSSLILADVVERVSSGEVGGGNFVLGPDKVRPKVAVDGALASFKRDQSMNLWMQVYNLALDEKTGKPAATIEYQVINIATGQAVMNISENVEQMRNTGDQLTLQKRLPLNGLLPGKYEVTIKINDLVSKQTISPAAAFQVE